MSETALNSIKDAAYIQTGAANFVGQCQNYAQTTFKKQIEKWQIAGIVYPVIAVQQTIKNKEINFEVGREKIHLHPNSVQVEIPL